MANGADDTNPKPEGEKRRRRKPQAEEIDAQGGNGNATERLTPDEEVFEQPTEQLIEAARAAEGQSPEKAIEAWRKVAHAAPQARLPRRELARVYRTAGRWNALVEALKELGERLPADRMAEKIEVLFEMADVYRERLKLDVMVIQTLNHVVAADPRNHRALDALEAQYESLKRWPDLIGILQKKVALSEGDTARQIELELRIANLYLEKFSNQAEAIKAYEKVLELDQQNTQALDFLKQMYERRRDWDKLIAAHQREIANLVDPAERLRRRVDVARLANEKVKKPQLSIELWRQVLEDEPEQTEALGELEKLYERERAWEELAAVLEKQAAKAADGTARVAALTKLGILYGEKLNDAGRAIEAWKRVAADEPENRRAVDALKKMYVQAHRWDDLESFYAPSGKWEELVRLLERQADVETDPAVRVDLSFRTARLWTERLNKEDRAARAFEKVLTLDENNLRAAEALIPMYGAAGDHRRLASVLAVQVRHTTEGADLVERLRRLVEIHEQQLKDQPGAFGYALQAVAAAPDEAWARDAAERLARPVGKSTELALSYEDALGRAEAGQVPMLETLVRLYENDLLDVDGALRSAQRLVRIDAENLGGLTALEAIYSRLEKFPELLEVLERKRTLVTDGEARRELLYNRAYLLEEELKDTDRAITAYRDLLDEAPDDTRALRALDRLYESQDRMPELAEILEREIAATPVEQSADVATLKMRLGNVRAGALSDTRGAIDSYRDVLALDLLHEGARRALEPYLKDEQHQATVARLLEPGYRASGDAPALIRALEVRARHEKDPVAAVEILVEVGRAWAGPLADRDRAFAAYRRAMQIDPGSSSLLGALEELADERPRAEQLAALLEEVLAKPEIDGVARRELLVHLAAVYEERLDDPATAVSAYRRVLEIEPVDDLAMGALERLYSAHGAWTELLEVYQRRVQNESDVTRRQASWFRIASLSEEMLSDVDGAIAAYQAVLSEDDGNVRALRALDRIFQATRRHQDLADILGREISIATDAPEKVTLLVRLARLREESLEEPASAVDTYKQALETDPSSEAARLALETYLRHPEFKLVAAQSLEPVYRTRADGPKLIASLEILADAALDPSKKIEVLREIARLREALADLEGAFATFARALAEDPTSTDLRRELERLARAVGWEALVTVYEERAAAAADDELQSGLLTRVAEISEQELRDPARAAAVYERVLEINPRHLPSADALERIYVSTDQFRPLVVVLQKKAEIVEDVAAKKEVGFKSAQVLEEVLDDSRGAIEVYRRILEADSEEPAALDALERLFLKHERWSDLRDIYMRKVDLARDPDDRKRVLYVLGQVYDRQLHESDKAIETYRAVLDIDADDATAMDALEGLYTEAERWHELLGVLDWKVSHAATTREAVSLKHGIGQVWEQQLSDPTRAVDVYREALELDPTYGPTLGALESMLKRSDPVPAARVLARIYDRAVEWEKLVRVLEVLAEHVDEDEKLQQYARIAQICERDLLDRSRAMDAQARAFRVRADAETTLSELERLAGSTGRFADLIGLYEKASIDTPDANLRCDLAMRVAAVQETAMADPDAAISWYRRALEADPESQPALDALERIFLRLDRPADLAEVLARKVESSKGADAVEQRFRLAQLRDQRLGDGTGALDAYREILAADAGHGPTIGALEFMFEQGQLTQDVARMLDPIYVGSAQWNKLGRLGETMFEAADGKDERRAVAARFAQIAENKLGDSVLAFAWWTRALRDDPAAEQPPAEIERLAALTSSWEDAASAYIDVIEGTRDASTRRTLLLRLARVFEEEIRDAERAEGAYKLALEIDERDAEVLEKLDNLYVRAGLSSSLPDVLVRRLDVVVDPDLIVELRLRLGAVREQIGETAGAVEAYRAVLERESRNTKALTALEQLHFRRAEWQELFAVYEQMVDLASDDSAMAECYARMAKIASDGLDDHARAEELWTRVLDVRGEETTALSELASIAEAGGRWTDAVAFLERQGAAEREDAKRVALLARVGRVLGDRLGDDAGAARQWNQILEIDADNLNALRALAGIYRRGEAWEQLNGSLQRILQAGHGVLNPDEVVSTLSEIAWVHGERLARPADAIENWRQVLAVEPNHREALDALDRLLLSEGRYREGVDILERKAALMEAASEQAAVLLRAAALWQDSIGDAEQAAAAYERVLERDSGSVEASKSLEQISRDKGRWERVVDLLIVRVDNMPDDAQRGGRIETLREVAKIYEHELGAPELALVALQAAFKEDFTDESVLADLERIAATTNKWNDLLTEYTQMARELQNARAAAALWTAIGRWYGERLNHVEYAVASLQQALALVPEHPKALSVLAAVYRRGKRWRDVADVLIRQGEAETEPKAKTQVLLELADVQESQTGEHQQAINTYEQALSFDDQCLDALESLDRLYRRFQVWDQLVDVLARKAAVLQQRDENPEDVVNLKLKVGEIWEDKLLDSQRATDAYKDALTLNPREARALRALERLYDKAGRFEDYTDILEQQLQAAQTDEERISLQERLAATWEEHFSRPERAAECYEHILSIDERHGGAFRALERIYRHLRRWEPLVETLRRHIKTSHDPSERAHLFAQLGETLEEELRDPHQAIAAYREIIDLEQDSVVALSALSRLYEKTEQWDRMLQVSNELAQIVTEPAQRVDLYFRLGRLQESRVGDLRGAEERYAQALEADPSHAPSLQALGTLYRNRGDWLKAAQLMGQAAEHTQNLVAKASLLYDGARIYEEKLDRPEEALRLYAKTLEVDPDHVGAATPLADHLWKLQQWPELEKVLEVVARKPEGREPKQLSHLYYRLARANAENGNAERALKYYKMSYDLDATSLDTLKGMAALHYNREEWDQAFRIYQTILVQHRDAQSGPETVDVYHRLGRIKMRQGEHKKALNMLAKAVEVDPTHRPTLVATVELYTALGDFEQVVATKRTMLEGASQDERYQLLLEIGAVCKDKLGNLSRAIDGFAEASALRPDDQVLLHQLLGLYTEAKQWKKSVETILRIADLEPDPLRSGKYHYSAAVIYRDELKSLDESVEHFNQALERYMQRPELITPENMAGFLKAFEGIDRILTQTKDWAGLQRNYRKMLKRMPDQGHDVLKVNLWHNLGEIYRTRLKDFKAATEAFEVATAIDPTNETRHQILSELYLLIGGDALPKAIREHQVLIHQNPSRIDSYRSLYNIYTKMGQVDRAWCVASVLSFLRKAEPQEQAFFEQYRPKSLVRARTRLSDELWLRNVMHPEQDKYISAIFALIAPVVYALKAAEPKSLGLNPKKERRNLAEDPLLFSKVFRYAHGVLNLNPVELYVKPEAAGMGLILAATKPTPAYVVGADLLQGRTERELAFAIGRQLAYLRPELMLRQIGQTGGALKSILLAAIKAVETGFAVPSTADFDELVKQMQRGLAADGPRAEQLLLIVRKFIASKAEIDLGRWMSAVDLTAQRVGLIVCGDLDTAARMVSMDQAPVGGISAKDKVKELMLYNLAEEYFTVRRELGLVVA